MIQKYFWMIDAKLSKICLSFRIKNFGMVLKWTPKSLLKMEAFVPKASTSINWKNHTHFLCKCVVHDTRHHLVHLFDSFVTLLMMFVYFPDFSDVESVYCMSKKYQNPKITKYDCLPYDCLRSPSEPKAQGKKWVYITFFAKFGLWVLLNTALFSLNAKTNLRLFEPVNYFR